MGIYGAAGGCCTKVAVKVRCFDSRLERMADACATPVFLISTSIIYFSHSVGGCDCSFCLLVDDVVPRATAA